MVKYCVVYFVGRKIKIGFYWLVKSGEVSAALGFRRFLSLIGSGKGSFFRNTANLNLIYSGL